jgi:hypothetical protein
MNYPYSTATGTIPKILSKIQNVGQPSKVDNKWMSSIGFTKTSEQRIIPILKFLGLIDKSGAPNGSWTKFRSNKTGKAELGKSIKEAYHELYAIYPDAHTLDKDELNHFFSTRTTAGPLALNHTINTFKNLANYAEFDDEKNEPEVIQEKTDSNELDSPVKSENLKAEKNPEETNFTNQLSKQFKESKSGLTVNLNIQLSVPETTDEKVYDKFFESLKKHLLS